MKIFLEADSITVDKVSGIGHATSEIIYAIEDLIIGTPHSLTLIIPFGKKSYLDRYKFRNVKVRTLPPLYKYVNYLFVRTSFPFPVDLLYGRGLYIFTNYKNWYVPFSKSFTFVHDVAYKMFPETINIKNLAYLRANMKRWLSRTSKIITISNSSSRDIKKYFPEIKNKVEVIYLGLNPLVYYPRTTREVNEVALKYGIEKNYFLYVGNIEPRKNILKLVEAYRLYADTQTNPAQLVLVGGGGWRDEEIRREIENVVKQGYKVLRPDKYVVDDDLPALYTGSRALVHVSLHEGYGLSLVQAQACGAPVIASNLQVFKETLDTKNVVYVNERDLKNIASAMTNSKKRTSSTVKSYKTPHTWQKTASDLLTLAGIMDVNEPK
jgi:glycosyltransferase involved in cell wall biosynthesis